MRLMALMDLSLSHIDPARSLCRPASCERRAAANHDIGREAFASMLRALRDGKLETTELTKILDSVASKLIDIGAQGLWQSALGGSSNGGLFGGLGTLFGGGSNSTNTLGFNPISGIVAAAGGGEFGSGRGWGVVGERGSELINVHSGGVTVYSNPHSKAMLHDAGKHAWSCVRFCCVLDGRRHDRRRNLCDIRPDLSGQLREVRAVMFISHPALACRGSLQ